MAFAIKAEVRDARAKTFAFTAQKTMYGGKHIADGDTGFVFASENESTSSTPRGSVESAAPSLPFSGNPEGLVNPLLHLAALSRIIGGPWFRRHLPPDSMRASPLIALLAAAIAGCTRTNAALMDNSVHLAPTCADGIKIYSSPEKVGAAYTEVALLNSTGSTGWTSESGMMTSMRKKAAGVGATGIIMGNINEPGAATKVAAAVLGTSAERKGKSVAIFAPSDTARVRSVCGATTG